MTTLVLASSSPYRRTLLARLGLPFSVSAPGVDETRRPGEAPAALARRLADAKARAAARAYADALVIGADQVALLGAEILSKPGGHEATVAQLCASAGRRVEFLTAVCVLNTRSGRMQTEVASYAVRLRALTRAQVEAYARRERPYDCAGGFKAEGLGVALFEAMQGEDPTALVGLPLIRLVAMLGAEGVDVLADT